MTEPQTTTGAPPLLRSGSTTQSSNVLNVSQDSTETQNSSIFSSGDLGANQSSTDTDDAQEDSSSKEDKGKEKETSIPEDPHDSAFSSKSSDTGDGLAESASQRYVIL